MTTTAFRPWRLELGSSCAADVLRYLLHCFRLRGGRVFDGVRWIYKVVREIAEATGYCERQVRRALVRLVELGFVIREQKEKHGIAPGDGGFRRRYWYAPGPSCPVPLRGRSQCRSEADMSAASSIPSNSAPSKSTTSKIQQSSNQQPKREGRIVRSQRTLLKHVEALAASGPLQRLHSTAQLDEWARNPMNPVNRKPSGFSCRLGPAVPTRN